MDKWYLILQYNISKVNIFTEKYTHVAEGGRKKVWGFIICLDFDKWIREIFSTPECVNALWKTLDNYFNVQINTKLSLEILW